MPVNKNLHLRQVLNLRLYISERREMGIFNVVATSEDVDKMEYKFKI